ncbi:MAG: MFS transporter [Sulfuricurvum sp.]|uniref:MFS transporter n=1 Tax=Sulfuricurvum sp. TaxID=2025608 RepID=UPI00262CDB55|nr:MFS transporter [Sulfuricurvum sp.]MDD5161078.1 MFS transporter [Sulfuricurvum sp.]
MKNNLRIYLLTLISFFVGTSQFVIAGVLDKISESMNISISAAGQLITVYAIASGIGTPIVAMVIAKHHQKKQLLIALSIFLTGVFLTPIATNFEFLILARMVTGIGAGVFVVVSYILASKLAKEGRQGSAMSNIALGFSLSLVLGVPIGRSITIMYDWQMIFWTILALVLIGTVFIIYHIPNILGQERIPLNKQLKLLNNHKVVLGLSLSFFIFIAFSIITTYIAPLLLSIKPINEHTFSLIFLLLGIASVIGSKLGASLADRIGIAPIIFTTLTIIILSFIMMYLFSHSLPMTIIMLLFWTMAMWMFGPTQSYNLSTLVPNASTILVGLNSSIIQVGFAAGAALGGIAISLFSIKSIIPIGILSVLIGILVFAQLLKIERNI